VKHLIALDLSLTCTGCVAAPLEWGGDWSNVVAREYAADALPKLKRGQQREQSEVERFTRIAHHGMRIAEWCWNLTGGADREHTEVWIEQTAYGQRSFSTSVLTELQTVVKFQLARYGIAFCMVPSSEARRLLLGNVPRRGDDAKDAVQATLRQAGCPVEWGQDLTDAACVLNFAMAHHGGHCFSTPRAA
jgi:hypothetical protein